MNPYSITVAVLVSILGVCIGSFLNVVIFRLGSGVKFTGRSKCLSCGKTLTPSMLIPLVSYIFALGRCRFCGSKVSSQYPLIEAITGALFLLVAVKNNLLVPQVPGLELLIATIEAIIWSVLMVVFVYDLKHKIIPDGLSLLFAVCAGVLLWIKKYILFLPLSFLPFLEHTPSVIDWWAAPLVALPLALVWLVTKGKGMGLGDAKLAWGIGWFLGFSTGVSAVVISFWIAFIPSITLLFLRSKRFTMKSEIPFAPFLVLGILVSYAFGTDIFTWTF